jgi:hypothetical protein
MQTAYQHPAPTAWPVQQQTDGPDAAAIAAYQAQVAQYQQQMQMYQRQQNSGTVYNQAGLVGQQAGQQAALYAQQAAAYSATYGQVMLAVRVYPLGFAQR